MLLNVVLLYKPSSASVLMVSFSTAKVSPSGDVQTQLLMTPSFSSGSEALKDTSSPEVTLPTTSASRRWKTGSTWNCLKAGPTFFEVRLSPDSEMCRFDVSWVRLRHGRTVTTMETSNKGLIISAYNKHFNIITTKFNINSQIFCNRSNRCRQG